jgi:hypothetical protein
MKATTFIPVLCTALKSSAAQSVFSHSAFPEPCALYGMNAESADLCLNQRKWQEEFLSVARRGMKLRKPCNSPKPFFAGKHCHLAVATFVPSAENFVEHVLTQALPQFGSVAAFWPVAQA